MGTRRLALALLAAVLLQALLPASDAEGLVTSVLGLHRRPSTPPSAGDKRMQEAGMRRPCRAGT
jgi:hypothetical protein